MNGLKRKTQKRTECRSQRIAHFSAPSLSASPKMSISKLSFTIFLSSSYLLPFSSLQAIFYPFPLFKLSFTLFHSSSYLLPFSSLQAIFYPFPLFKLSFTLFLSSSYLLLFSTLQAIFYPFPLFKLSFTLFHSSSYLLPFSSLQAIFYPFPLFKLTFTLFHSSSYLLPFSSLPSSPLQMKALLLHYIRESLIKSWSLRPIRADNHRLKESQKDPALGAVRG